MSNNGDEMEAQALNNLIREHLTPEWAIEANSRLEYEKYNGMQLRGNPEANPVFKQARNTISKAKGE